jgi:RNA polymerase sigma-70 factor (ECF subfamily)
VPESAASLSSRDFARAYARFFPPIQAKCRRLLSNRQAADDVAQEAFVRLWQWRSRPSLDAPDAARTVLAWLYRTSTRLALDGLRSARSSSQDDRATPCIPCAVDLDTALAARRAILAVAGAVADHELHAAILCRLDGLSQPEAALVLRTSERTVRRLLARFDERTNSVRKEFAP